MIISSRWARLAARNVFRNIAGDRRGAIDGIPDPQPRANWRQNHDFTPWFYIDWKSIRRCENISGPAIFERVSE